MAYKNQIKIDTSDMTKKIKKMQLEYPSFTERLLQRIGMRLMASVKRLTPVDTGHLKKNWFLLKPIVNKFTSQIEIVNNVKYSEAVEKGHRTKGGGFVPGKYMLKKSMSRLEKRLPKVVDSEIQTFIKKHGGD